jgi:hypothetical protein
MDAKNVIFGETGIDRLVQVLRSHGHPMPLTKLTERYLDIIREQVLIGEAQQQQNNNSGKE